MTGKKLHILKHWQQRKKKKDLLHVLRDCDRHEIEFLCECALNIVNGNIPFNVDKLTPFEKQMKILCEPQTTDRKRRKVLSSTKGLKLLELISRPCYCYLSE